MLNGIQSALIELYSDVINDIHSQRLKTNCFLPSYGFSFKKEIKVSSSFLTKF